MDRTVKEAETKETTPEAAGNTKPAANGAEQPKIKSRAFQLTLNEIEKYKDLIEYIKHFKQLTYYISCKEKAPTTGHEHIHLYCKFKDKVTLKIDKLQGAHIEICKGSPKQNIDYIKKDGNILEEYGTRPTQGKINYDYFLNTKIEDILNDTSLNLTQKKTILNIQNEIKKKETFTKDNIYKPDFKAYYIYGPSGSGKSRYAINNILNNVKFDLIAYDHGFYRGVTNEAEAALFDDFRPSCMKPDEFIRLIDYNKHNMNIKGGQMINNYNIIVITSIKNPYRLYNKDDEEVKQWIRRLTIINIEDLNNNNDDEILNNPHIKYVNDLLLN